MKEVIKNTPVEKLPMFSDYIEKLNKGMGFYINEYVWRENYQPKLIT